MRLFALFFLALSSLPSYANPVVKNFICDGEYEVVFATVTINSQEDFDVKLRSKYSDIDVWSKWITFDEKGEMTNIRTSGGVENFEIQKIEDGKWIGEYWYDNSLYRLNCSHD